MTPTQLKALFRSDMVDVDTPYLWSDSEVTVYLDESQSMFSRLTGGEADGTTDAITKLTIKSGDSWVSVDPRVLRVRTAAREDNGRPIEVMNIEDMEKRGLAFNTSNVGQVRALVLGIEREKARVYPTSNEDVNLRLTVFRMPKELVSESGEFEIEDKHHFRLLDWMRHLAYLKQDTETFDKSKAQENEDRFRAYCEEVKRELARQRHKPRAVMYGGL